MFWVVVYDISTTACDLWGTDRAKCTRTASLSGQRAGDIFEGRGEHRN